MEKAKRNEGSQTEDPGGGLGAWPMPMDPPPSRHQKISKHRRLIGNKTGSPEMITLERWSSNANNLLMGVIP
jgi:hypothetical protein